MAFPEIRPRRLRYRASVRELVRENRLTPSSFIMPLFLVPGENIKTEISALPGQFHFSVDKVIAEVQEASSLGIHNFILFGIPDYKDADGSSSWDDNGIIQRATRALKEEFPKLNFIADLCFCEYTDHGHCGVLHNTNSAGNEEMDVENDKTLENLVKQAISLCRSGTDIIAPSGNMDGMVKAIRQGLDSSGFSNIPIMSYAVKYHSAFYGPFKEAVKSAPSFGDRQTYQMDPANSREAIKEVLIDIEEGADMVMVKPALSYLDIIYQVKNITNVPVAAYNVSGEYSIIKCAANAGLINHDRTMLEVLTSIKRAGADIIITYFAKDASKLI